MANSFSGISRPLAILLILVAIVGAVMFVWPRFTHSISGQKLLNTFEQVQSERAAASEQASDDNRQRAEERQQQQAKAADTGLPRFGAPGPAVGEKQPSGFAQNNASQQSGDNGGAAPQSFSSNSGSKNDQQMTPQQIQNNQAQAEMKDLQQQQQIAEQREQLKQQQREAVPSLLTDNPPSPVNLGAKY